jgi:hypothetical protein
MRSGMLRSLRLCSVTVALVSCSEGTGTGSDACPQTFEFGNYGCARIQGTVRNAAGEPIQNARVSVGPPADVPNSYDSPSVDTDATGVYSLEIHQYGPPVTPKAADTVAMYLRAFLLSEGAPVGDSLPVQMIFVPVGTVPDVTETDITLD